LSAVSKPSPLMSTGVSGSAEAGITLSIFMRLLP
jgi:hypothetical protein